VEALALHAGEVSLDTATRIGRGLGLLHLSPIRTFTQQTLEQECQALVENVCAVAAIHPEMQPQIDAVGADLQRHLPDLPRLPLVPSHGTFKLNHLMADGGTLSLLDFDSMTAADPMFDVANFTSDVHYLEAQGDLPAGRAAALSGAMQNAYFATVPWGRCQRVLDWYVASLLLRKQAYKTVKHLHGDAVSKIGTVIQEALSRTRRLDS
jgi:thiamine kinase-like enzyme